MGVGWFLRGFARLRLRNRILGLATSRVRSMAMGSVEIQGHVRLETDIVDPIFQRPCGYFRVVVEEKRGSGRRRHWVKIYERDSSPTPFFLEDETGLARVSPAKAELHIAAEVNTTSNGLARGFRDDAVSRFLTSLGSTWNSRRITAHILREGQPLFLVGYASPTDNAALNHRLNPRDAARALKSDPAAMKGLDANKDGAVDAHEWERGVANKARELADQVGAAAPVLVDPIITVTRSPDGTLIFADNEKALLSKLDWTAWAGILGGPAVALASAVYLLRQYGVLSPGLRHLTGTDLPDF